MTKRNTKQQAALNLLVSAASYAMWIMDDSAAYRILQAATTEFVSDKDNAFKADYGTALDARGTRWEMVFRAVDFHYDVKIRDNNGSSWGIVSEKPEFERYLDGEL